MNWFDWLVVAVYLVGLLTMSYFLGRRQKDGKDYYLAGNQMSALPIALSTTATQCSTNSLLGAPAFVALGAGLVWLQYELAVPLAMIVCILLIYPIFRRRNFTSVYEYLEQRYSAKTRLTVAVLFMFFRALGTGITLYGVSLMVVTCLGIPFYLAVLCIGVATIAYDTMGGLRAVIWSDVIQFGLLFGAVLLAIIFCLIEIGGWNSIWSLFPAEQSSALNFNSGDNEALENYEFWPMLIGGFFIYVSYYGCDQTQAQRELSSRNVQVTQQALFYDGLIRFPLVMSYCFLGVCIGAYIQLHPEFLDLLRINTDTGMQDPDAAVQENLVVPTLAFELFPHGCIGLIAVGMFAAAMSSLDSTINSLSAVTMEDVLPALRKKRILKRNQLRYSRLTTLFWGAVIVASSFIYLYTGDNIVKLINKIGSLYNGPLLAVFIVGMLTTGVSSRAILWSFGFGILLNLLLWLGTLDLITTHVYSTRAISFWWWNPIGFFSTAGLALFLSRYMPRYVNRYKEFQEMSPLSIFYSVALFAYFLFILFVLYFMS